MSYSLEGKIKDVYQENLADELRKISELIEKYNYVAMVYFILYRKKLFNFLKLKLLGYRIPWNSLPFKCKYSILNKKFRQTFQ